jgi:uncharacterized protein
MTMRSFERRQALSVSAETAFAWHERPGAFERLTPPWAPVELIRAAPNLRDGAEAMLRVGTWPLRFTWLARHEGYQAGQQFRDVQEQGPFRRWEHTHRFVPTSDGNCQLIDHVEFELPGGALGAAAARWFLPNMLERMFRYRQRITREDLEFHARHAKHPRLRVAVSGAGGLVGSALVPLLSTGGHDVVRLVRRPRENPVGTHITWNPDLGELDAARLEGLDAVVHLAGANIAEGRWSLARKREILESRVRGTRLLAETLAQLSGGPRTLVCASAVGFYGDRGEEELVEDSASGRGFLAEVCRAWEAAADAAREAGVRVVSLRFGVVLSPLGGALAKMLPPFRLGGGGPLGSGEQWMSWIGLDDAASAILHALLSTQLTGPVNATTPHPVRNREFGRTLGAVLRRPALARFPAAAARLVWGEMADELLLASTRALPGRLRATDFSWRAAALPDALRGMLGRETREPELAACPPVDNDPGFA